MQKSVRASFSSTAKQFVLCFTKCIMQMSPCCCCAIFINCYCLSLANKKDAYTGLSFFVGTADRFPKVLSHFFGTQTHSIINRCHKRAYFCSCAKSTGCVNILNTKVFSESKVQGC